MRQELEQCSTADLEAIEAPRFMFLRYSDDQGFRVRHAAAESAQELLDERDQGRRNLRARPAASSRPTAPLVAGTVMKPSQPIRDMMTEHQQAETPQPGTEAKPVAPDDDMATRSPQELKEMTLDELLDSLPLKPWDKDDPDPLVQLAIRLSATTAPADQDADDQPAAPAEWRSPTMLSPEGIESLRQEAEQSSERMRAILAARCANS